MDARQPQGLIFNNGKVLCLFVRVRVRVRVRSYVYVCTYMLVRVRLNMCMFVLFNLAQVQSVRMCIFMLLCVVWFSYLAYGYSSLFSLSLFFLYIYFFAALAWQATEICFSRPRGISFSLSIIALLR